MELRSVFLILFVIAQCYSPLMATKECLKTEYKWSQIEFKFTSDQERKESIKNGTFNEGKVQPIDVQFWYSGNRRTVFTTFPRIGKGIPASLGIVTNKYRKGNPVVDPYPSWEWHINPEKCKEHRIVSVYRVFIDECKRLWVLDNGIIGNDQICSPQILAFNLKTNRLVRKYEIPFDQHLNKSLYITPVVESRSTDCDDTFVYNADCKGPSLLVYDFKKDKSWRIMDESFNPDPDYAIYDIDGTVFKVMDGIFGLALSPLNPPLCERKLFYHAMSSGNENWVYTKHLKNESLFSTEFGASQIFHTYPKKRKTQSAAEAMDKSGNLYFGLLGDIKIASWNIKDPYDDHYFCIVGDNKKTMQFPSGMKVTPNNKGRECLWIFATAYQKIAMNEICTNQTNFYILSALLEI